MATTSRERKEKEAKKLLQGLGYEIIPEKYVKCNKCGKTKSVKSGNFYYTSNELFSGWSMELPDHNGVNRDRIILPVCKSCIEELYEEHLFNSHEDLRTAIYRLTGDLRIPWSESLFDTAISSKTDAYRAYIAKLNSLPQYSSLTMLNSEKFEEASDESENSSRIKSQNNWGSKYDREQVEYLNSLYKNMQEEYTIVTTQHKETLKLVCKMQLRLDELFELNDMSNFTKLNKEYLNILQSSGLRPIDKKSGSDKYGLRSFSQIYEEVEKDGFVKPKPVTYQQDIVDKTIQYILNYNRKMVGKEILSVPPDDTPKVDEVD